MQKSAIFWDRDGVVTKQVPRDGGYWSPREFAQLKLTPNIEEVFGKARAAGFLNIIFTNQPDIANGLMAEEDLRKMNAYLHENLAVDDIFVCPHNDQDDCACRKPKPGMILEAASKWNINLSKSFVIGDTPRDLEAAANAGVRAILIDAFYNQDVLATFRVATPGEAFDIVKASV